MRPFHPPLRAPWPSLTPRGLRLAWLTALTACASLAGAQTPDTAPPPQQPPAGSPSLQPNEAAAPPVAAAASAASAPENGASTLRYTLGAKIKFADFGEVNRDTAKLRPIVGARWGRWRLGIGDGTEWLRFSGFRKEPGLSYEGLESRRVRMGLSLRVLNMDTGQDFDPFEKGRLTVRGRGSANVDLNEDWTLGLDLSHDLLDRGDGSTMGLGLSRSWVLSESNLLLFSGGWTWATGEHWRSAYRDTEGADLAALGTGWGSVGLGLAWRHRIDAEWSWFASAGPSRAMGQVGSVVGSQWVWGGQAGVLRFFR